MKIIKSAYFLILVLLWMGCQRRDQLGPEGSRDIPSVFFDLKGYFNEEIQRLEKEAPTVRKTARLNGKEEVLENQKINFSEELNVFKELDINKLAWTDKYIGDTTFVGDKISNIIYQAQVEDLKTKRLEITFANGKVSSVGIESGSNSLIASSQKKLHYLPSKGFSIDHQQDMLLTKNRTLSVTIDFEN